MSDESIKETVCTNCEHSPEKETAFCPECGEEDPWKERNKFEFDKEDLPITFSHRCYEDDYQIWNSFSEDYFDSRLQRKHIANLPNNFPRLKIDEVEIWYGIDKSLKLHGPFMTERRVKEDMDIV